MYSDIELSEQQIKKGKTKDAIYTGEVLNPNTGVTQKPAENVMFYGEEY